MPDHRGWRLARLVHVEVLELEAQVRQAIANLLRLLLLRDGLIPRAAGALRAV